MLRPAFSALLVSLALAPAALWVAWQADGHPSSHNRRKSYFRTRAVTSGRGEVSPPADADTAAPGAGDVLDPPDPRPRPPLDSRMLQLRAQVREALEIYRHRPVNARDNTPWETFHWILAYNVDAEIHTSGPGGETANAVGWLCYNYPCRGQRLLDIRHGMPTALYGVGLEGHNGQFLAILGQSRVMIDYPLLIKGQQFTVADLVKSCQLSCESGKDVELTFLLIALSHYLHPDEVWKNRSGETWSIPRLVREEIAKPIRGAACGGTHRLMGLSYAVRKRQQHNLPVTGEYRRAQIYVNEYIDYALRMQNSDGSMSTEWFTGRGARRDIDRRLQTSGHILEWIVFAVPDERLQDPQIVRAVDYVSRILVEERRHEWKIGHLGHGLRSLSLYDRRVFQPLDEETPLVARREASPDAAAEPEDGEIEDSSEDRVTTKPPSSDSPGEEAAGELELDPPPVPPGYTSPSPSAQD